MRAVGPDVARLTAHFVDVEEELRARPMGQLDPVRRLVRGLLVDELARYGRARRFPKNRDSRRATPSFVDADGTRCAAAHLLEVGGAGAFVARIARIRNHALVPALAGEPGLAEWIAAAGLTLDELARIQPSYTYMRANCICPADPRYPGSVWARAGVPNIPAAGVLDTEGIGPGRVVNTARVRVNAIFGDAAGHHVGDLLTVANVVGSHAVSTLPAPGEQVLIPLPVASQHDKQQGSPPDAEVVYTGVILYGGTPGTCPGGTLKLTKEQTLNVLRAEDCHDALARIDAAWLAVADTAREPAPKPRGCNGCSTASAADASSASWVMLATLVAALTVRARRRC